MTEEEKNADAPTAEAPKQETPEGDSEMKESETKAKDSEDKKEGEKEETEEDKKKKDELRKKYANWPLRNIKEPHDNDVMYGRGGGTNHHPGNKQYRKIVEDRKLEYVNSKRLDKPLVALEIIRSWRAQIPPGRFLKLDEKTGLWNDVGDKKAREKTSQALREKAPLIRKQQEEEHPDDGEEETKEEVKSTRFAEGTKGEASSAVKKAILARDHSLGREFLQAGESVSLEGFSWQDPFKAGARTPSLAPAAVAAPAPAHPKGPPPVSAYPAGRNSSHGSLGMAPPHHTSSIGGAPPPPDYWGRVTSGERQREFSSGRYESWGTPYTYGPPPAPGTHAPVHQRSGSWTHAPPQPPPPPHAPVHQRSGSWSAGREHSLSMIPLAGASVSRPADRAAFDSGRASSGYWMEPASSGRTIPPPPPPPPGQYGGPGMSDEYSGPYRQPPTERNSISPANSTPSPKPAYNVDMSIAKSWSGGEVQTAWSEAPQYDDHPRPLPGADSSPMRLRGQAPVPRPQMVKRDTSHQNESYETKPSVKRAALNRDNSLASNRLKQEYMPEYYPQKFDTENEMRQLSDNLQQSKLSPKLRDPPKPNTLSSTERVSTMDVIALEFAKPHPLMEGNRMSTIDALDLDFGDDFQSGTPQNGEGLEVPDLKHDLPKPSTLIAEDRLTTKDFMDLVNSPIGEDDRPASQGDISEGDPLPLNQERKIAEEWLTQV